MSKGWLVFSRKERSGRKVWIAKFAPTWRQERAPAELVKRVDVDRWAERRAAELLAATPTAPATKRVKGPTIRSKHEAWIALREARTGLHEATIANNKTHLNAQILPTIGDEAIAALDVPRLRQWVRELRGRCRSGSHVRNVLATLVSFVDDAIGEGWIAWPANPARAKAVRAELPPPGAAWGARQAPHLAIAQATQLLACPAIPIERAVRYAIAFTAGPRDGEIAGLTWGDLNLEGATPTFRVTKALAVRGKKGFATEQDPKSRHAIRTAPLHTAAVAALLEYREEYWIPKMLRKPLPTDPVFVGARGKATRPKSAAKLRDDLEAAELPATFAEHNQTFHGLRRSAITWLRQAGVEGVVLDQIMGHAGKGASAGNYTAELVQRMADALALLPFAWPTLVRTAAHQLVRSAPNTAKKASSMRRGWDSNPRMTVLQDVAVVRAGSSAQTIDSTQSDETAPSGDGSETPTVSDSRGVGAGAPNGNGIGARVAARLARVSEGRQPEARAAVVDVLELALGDARRSIHGRRRMHERLAFGVAAIWGEGADAPLKKGEAR